MTPLVSICCITYNHEKYIADAIESFLMQKTDFPYEIIIHDDASTDNTAKIIREYEKKFPETIRAIYQKENQYSKKVKISQFIAPMVRGKYVATCEGDDYWIDPYKLKKQVEFLENNPGYSMCFHSVAVVDTEKNFKGRFLGLKCRNSRDISISEAATGGIVHVSSRLIRKSFYTDEKPTWVSNARHGDYAIALYLCAEGKVYFMDEVMSCYRTGVEGSMMTRYRESYSVKNDIEYHKNRVETLCLANQYYNYKYDNEISKVILQSEVKMLLLQRKVDFCAIKKYLKFINVYGIVRFIKTVLLAVFPKLAGKLISFVRNYRLFFYKKKENLWKRV